MIGRLALTPVTGSIVVLIVANLVPLAGALFGGWSVYEVVLLYWAENVVIGLYQIARMMAVMVLRREGVMLLLAAFFVLHYGVFTMVHGHFVVGMLGPDPAAGLESAVALLLAPEGLLLALLALLASHGFAFTVHFLRGGEWRDAGLKELMVAPYARIVVLHLVILGGGLLLVTMGEPVAALALMVVLKIGIEIIAHVREHRG